ncbi:Periplasmic binding protein domain protein [Neomoorella glycerini]|uniref:Periplasmic binding protein domain protein n=1 Tax=Neomoorella glycerini TaxID=55779 RepID=A0A6I5ZQH9_9FIRM|nr:substrate-binding domain-containing protein [Moorella glycerini]QGP91966.1 Periplasmic binding protein domain protein [Moorella glycerini]
MKNAKWVLLTLVVALLVALIVGCGQKQASNSGTSGPQQAQQTQKKLKIGYIYLTLEHPYYQAHQKWTQKWAKDMGIDLVELDGKMDAGTMTNQIENLVAQKVDGIVYCLVNPASGASDINYAQQNGIPIISFAIKHGNAAKAPFVGIDELTAGKMVGKAAAEKFKQLFPNKKAKIALIRMPGVEATENRANGFVEGFKSVISDATVVAEVDGGGVRDKSMAGMEAIIQAHPELNVVYGINGDSALGALAALEGAGRGTIKTELVVSHDGSEPEILKLINPDSALKVSIANQPKELSKATLDTILEVINKKRDMKNTDNIYVPAKVLEPDIDKLQQFIKEEYWSTTDLKAEAAKFKK